MAKMTILLNLNMANLLMVSLVVRLRILKRKMNRKTLLRIKRKINRRIPLRIKRIYLYQRIWAMVTEADV